MFTNSFFRFVDFDKLDTVNILPDKLIDIIKE
jgi:hypothetical protein